MLGPRILQRNDFAEPGERMKNKLWKDLGKSVLRIAAVLAVILGVPALCYLVWQPGSGGPLPGFRGNAIWIGHGWLGDDAWFERNHRDMAAFRSPEKISALFQRLADNRIRVVYPHLCPARPDGQIAACDDAQTEHFLDLAAKYGIAVIPWIGGVFGESARPADPLWRRNFIASVNELLRKHPRFAGVQINIEPMPSGNADFLLLLDQLRPTMNGKTLSVAAYPPPTGWHRFPDVHWQLSYMQMVSDRCDQLAVMMYDTAIPLEKFYTDLVIRWTRSAAGATGMSGCELILGIPAYEDAESGYHHPRGENISSALRGIAAAGRNESIGGIAIYCEWEMDDAKWREWQRFMPLPGPER